MIISKDTHPTRNQTIQWTTPGHRNRAICHIKFVTCGEVDLPPDCSFRDPVIVRINARRLPPPPPTSASDTMAPIPSSEISTSTGNRSWATRLREELRNAGLRRCTVLVFCKAGVHRSVAVAEALAEEAEEWEEVAGTEVKHLDLRRR